MASPGGLYGTVLQIKELFESLDGQVDPNLFFIEYCRTCEHVLREQKDIALFESMLQVYFSYPTTATLFQKNDVKQSILDAWEREIEDATIHYRSIGSLEGLSWAYMCANVKKRVFMTACGRYEGDRKERTFTVSDLGNGC